MKVRFVTPQELAAFPTGTGLFSIEHVFTPEEAAARETERQARKLRWAAAEREFVAREEAAREARRRPRAA